MDVVKDPVRLTYTLTADDLRRGLRANRRHTRGYRVRRLLRWAAAVAIVVAVLAYALSVALGDDGPSWIEIIFVGLLVVVGVFAAWNRSRAFRGIATYYGQIVATVGQDGLQVSTERSTGTTRWSAYSRWVETPDAFVLVGQTRRPEVITVLPKRALSDGAEGDRLRSILIDHIPTA